MALWRRRFTRARPSLQQAAQCLPAQLPTEAAAAAAAHLPKSPQPQLYSCWSACDTAQLYSAPQTTLSTLRFSRLNTACGAPRSSASPCPSCPSSPRPQLSTMLPVGVPAGGVGGARRRRRRSGKRKRAICCQRWRMRLSGPLTHDAQAVARPASQGLHAGPIVCHPGRLRAPQAAGQLVHVTDGWLQVSCEHQPRRAVLRRCAKGGLSCKRPRGSAQARHGCQSAARHDAARLAPRRALPCALTSGCRQAGDAVPASLDLPRHAHPVSVELAS